MRAGNTDDAACKQRGGTPGPRKSLPPRRAKRHARRAALVNPPEHSLGLKEFRRRYDQN
ncbi:hypothetical protein UKMH10_3855 [Burkholderia pseudomallei]|nr:conserved hypothetical protein [Burkholderia pseudomallei 668]VUD63140.1 hypothetical protein UKMH10_3855 [Burkholderia pseudomallei]